MPDLAFYSLDPSLKLIFLVIWKEIYNEIPRLFFSDVKKPRFTSIACFKSILKAFLGHPNLYSIFLYEHKILGTCFHAAKNSSAETKLWKINEEKYKQ